MSSLSSYKPSLLWPCLHKDPHGDSRDQRGVPPTSFKIPGIRGTTIKGNGTVFTWARLESNCELCFRIHYNCELCNVGSTVILYSLLINPVDATGINSNIMARNMEEGFSTNTTTAQGNAQWCPTWSLSTSHRPRCS